MNEEIRDMEVNENENEKGEATKRAFKIGKKARKILIAAGIAVTVAFVGIAVAIKHKLNGLEAAEDISEETDNDEDEKDDEEDDE